MVERLRPVYEEWARGNWRAGAELYDSEVEITARVGEGLITSRGHEQVAMFMREFLDTWEQYSVEAHEFEENGDLVFVSGRQRGRGAASGVSLDIPVFHVWRFRDSHVVSFLATPNEDEAREAAGL